jgi:Fic family protein
LSSLHDFQPLLPDERARSPLVERAAALVAEAHRLESAAGALTGALGPLLRAMNTYYTNKIEGQQTRPADIERALAKRFDADEHQAKKQRLALAHIETEAELEAELEGSRPRSLGTLYEAAFVRRIHASLYGKLPAEERRTDTGAPIEPGAWRVALVTAGPHLAPPPADVPELLRAWQETYARLPRAEQAAVGAACAHHRLLLSAS